MTDWSLISFLIFTTVVASLELYHLKSKYLNQEEQEEDGRW